MCGYLGSPDALPFNAGKQEEVKRRVKHLGMGRLGKFCQRLPPPTPLPQGRGSRSAHCYSCYRSSSPCGRGPG
ncbi:hypothetical protein ACVXG7_31660 [Enterobacter hormaechei]